MAGTPQRPVEEGQSAERRRDGHEHKAPKCLRERPGPKPAWDIAPQVLAEMCSSCREGPLVRGGCGGGTTPRPRGSGLNIGLEAGASQIHTICSRNRGALYRAQVMCSGSRERLKGCLVLASLVWTACLFQARAVKLTITGRSTLAEGMSFHDGLDSLFGFPQYG
jgi:hypothetical protein